MKGECIVRKEYPGYDPHLGKKKGMIGEAKQATKEDEKKSKQKQKRETNGSFIIIFLDSLEILFFESELEYIVDFVRLTLAYCWVPSNE